MVPATPLFSLLQNLSGSIPLASSQGLRGPGNASPAPTQGYEWEEEGPGTGRDGRGHARRATLPPFPPRVCPDPPGTKAKFALAGQSRGASLRQRSREGSNINSQAAWARGAGYPRAGPPARPGSPQPPGPCAKPRPPARPHPHRAGPEGRGCPAPVRPHPRSPTPRPRENCKQSRSWRPKL